MRLRLPLLVVLFISLAFVAFRSFFIFPVYSDENIYINMAKAVKDGLVPYKDFFYAHPPVQLLLFQPVLWLFGANFAAMKIFMTLIGVGCVVLTYLIGKEMFGEQAAFVAAVAFLLFPGFLIFSNQALGMFEALFFFLFGFYFILRKHVFASSVFFTLAVFTRYLTVLLLPFVFYYLFAHQRGTFRKQVLVIAACIAGAALICFALFGAAFFTDTVVYHLQENLNVKAGVPEWFDQYLSLGLFTTFMALAVIGFAYTARDKKLLLFASYPLLYDVLVLAGFRAVLYHYSLLALPLLFIAAGAAFARSEGFRIPLLIMFALSVATNAGNIALYFDAQHSDPFPALVNYTRDHAGATDAIFGEPLTTNYISFVTGVPIAGNYFDSGAKFIRFEGPERVRETVRAAKPSAIVIDNVFDHIANYGPGYELVRSWNVSGSYHVSLYRAAG